MVSSFFITFLNWDKRAAENRPLLISLLGCIVLLFAIFYWAYPPAVNLFTDDANEYIGYAPTRTVGYPFLLSVINWLTGGFDAIPLVQLSFLCAAVFIAALSFSKFFGSLTLGTVLAVSVLSISGIVKFCFEIYTESIGVSLLLLLSAACVNFIKKPSRKSLFSLGLLVGLAILIRPSSYALLGPVIVLFLFYRNQLMNIMKGFLPPLVLCLLIGASVNYARHGFFSTQSYMGHNLYGKVAFALKPGMKSHDPLETEMMDKMTESMFPIQEELAKIDSLRLYYILSTPLYDKLRFFLLNQFKSNMPEFLKIKDLDAFYKSVALKIIAQNPSAYIKDVLIHYSALWFVWDLITPPEKEQLARWIGSFKETKDFKAIEQDYSLYKFRDKIAPVIYLIRGFLYFCFCLSFVFIGNAFWCLLKKRPLPHLWGFGLFLSLSIHALYLSTALLQAGYPRYSMFMWPYMLMMFLTFSGICFDFLRGKRS